MHSHQFSLGLKRAITAAILIFVLFPLAVGLAHGAGKGPKSPEWLTTSETYSAYLFEKVPWEFLKTTKWKFATHVPESREHLMALRAAGMRGFPYMTYYQAPFVVRYQGVRISEHTDWLMVDEKGDWVRNGFWYSGDQKNWYCPCFNTAGFRQAMLSYVETLMKMGAGGIFLDNVGDPLPCYGEKHGAHKHLYKTQKEAFAMLLKETRALIKKYDPEGALLINSAMPATLPKEFWTWIDCEMSESYICTWVNKTRWFDWNKDWNGIDKKIADQMKLGKQVCCLSYTGHTNNSLKDDCYFCYASTRLMNMIWNGGSEKIFQDPECYILYQIETGQPVTEELVAGNGVHYRIFKNGMVAVNPTDKDATIDVKHKWPTSVLKDLYARVPMDVAWQGDDSGTVKLSVPAQSGRVYLCEPSKDPYVRPGFAAQPKPRSRYVLTIATNPQLGKASFKVDGLPMWTFSGFWSTEYELGPDYGKCIIYFDSPGTHKVEVLTQKIKGMRIGTGYGNTVWDDDVPGAEPQPDRLNKLMDPANPAQPLEGDGYVFECWEGAAAGSGQAVEVMVDRPATLVAKYRKQ